MYYLIINLSFNTLIHFIHTCIYLRMQVSSRSQSKTSIDTLLDMCRICRVYGLIIVGLELYLGL